MSPYSANPFDAEDSPWVLGIDVGTSLTKAILFDTRGIAVPGARVQIPNRAAKDASGAFEFPVESLIESVVKAIDALLQMADEERTRIAAVGCCSFWHSSIGVDASGEAVGPVYTWADRRPESAVDAIRARVDAASFTARTGAPLHSSFYPARLSWLRSERADEFARAARWISPAEFLYHRLFGSPAPSVCMASATGLLDQDRCDWDDEALSVAGLRRDQVPELDLADPPLCGPKPDWAERWPALASIPWARPIGDGAASNIGSGCLAPERAAVNLGTSGAIRVAHQDGRPDVPQGLWRYRIDARRALVGGAFSDGGNVSDWCNSALIDRADAGAARDAHGLTVLPFLGGERSLGWRPNASATIHGMTLSTTPADIRRAFREAVALRFALVARMLRQRFPEMGEIVLSGGAPARFPDWYYLLADATAMPVRTVTEPEASCRGAALVAMTKAGILASEGEAASVHGALIAPDADGQAALEAALARQEELYRRMAAPL